MPTTTINLTGQALSKVDDTNVTLTIGGTPLTALLKATSLTLGWSGQLSIARGGTGLSSLGTASQLIRVNGAGTALEYFTPTYGSGTVTTVSVLSANGFAGTVANAGTTPAITLSTTITGLLKGNGTAISAASASDVTGQLLTGYVSGAGTVAATDTILQAFNKLNGNIGALVTGVSSVNTYTGAVTLTKSDVGLGSVENTALSTWAGTTNITTLGTIATGVWQGTAIGKAYGGTGVNIGTTALTLGTASTTAGQLTLSNATNAFTQTIRGTNPGASIIYDLPTTAPTAGQVLQSTAPSAGVATLSWATASSGITVGTTTITSGTSTRVAFNDGGVYGEDADLTWDKTNNILNSTGGYNVNGIKSIRHYATETIAFGEAIPVLGSISGNYNTIVGCEAAAFGLSGAKNVLVGQAAYISSSGAGSYNTILGSEASTAGANSQIVIGYLATATAANQGVLGSNSANGYVSNWYFNGVTHTAAYATVLNACGGSGTNNAGTSLTLAGGKSTGSAAGGALVFRTSTTLGSGTTAQSLVSRLTISGGAVTTDASTATWADALDFVLGSTTGTKFGTATTQKLAFWNATPIVQITTAVGSATLASPGSGTNIKSDDTFDGYTLQQVVKALRNLGLLA